MTTIHPTPTAELAGASFIFDLENVALFLDLDGTLAPIAATPAAVDRGLLVEDKGLSVTLHYRNAPGCADAVRELAQKLAKVTGLALQEGHMVVELRTPGLTKGDAVAAFMAEPPFTGARPIYIGDDLTDEAAFAAVAEAGGYGVLVGPERDTAAAWRLDDVDQVLAWLGVAVSA